MALKSREKILLGAALLIGVVMGFDQFVTLPKKKEAQELRKQVREWTEHITSKTSTLSSLQPLRRRVEEKQQAAESLTGRITDETQLDILLDQWGKESRMRKVDLVQITVKEETEAETIRLQGASRGFFKKVGMEVGLLADYRSIGPSLQSVLSLPLLQEWEEVEISRKEESFPKLEVNLKTYLYMSSPVRKGQSGKRDGS